MIDGCEFTSCRVAISISAVSTTWKKDAFLFDLLALKGAKNRDDSCGCRGTHSKRQEI
jgi:hypothetical protein